MGQQNSGHKDDIPYKIGSRMEAPPLVDCRQCKHYQPGLSGLSASFFEIHKDLSKAAFCGECTRSRLPIQEGMICDELTQRS